MFEYWETIPSEILNVLKFRNLHKSRANRFARRGNLTRVSGNLVDRIDLCSSDSRVCGNLPRFVIEKKKVAVIVGVLSDCTVQVEGFKFCDE